MSQRLTSILITIEPDLVDRLEEVFPKDDETQGLPRAPKKNRSAFIRRAIRDRIALVEEKLAKQEGRAA